MDTNERCEALLEVIEQLHGWIVELDSDPMRLCAYLGGTPDEMNRWEDALGALGMREPDDFVSVVSAHDGDGPF